jgi:chemotaxis protein MotA
VFSKCPRLLKNHHAVPFVCATLRMYVTGGVGFFELGQMMELDMDVHHHDAYATVAALSTVADSLPGIDIVAAVKGVALPWAR